MSLFQLYTKAMPNYSLLTYKDDVIKKAKLMLAKKKLLYKRTDTKV